MSEIHCCLSQHEQKQGNQTDINPTTSTQLEGTVKVNGEEVQIRKPGDAIKRGVAFLPEDRKDEGIIPVRSVEENINISSRRNNLKCKFFLKPHWERENAESFIQKLSIKSPSRHQIIQNLSGGNQQKAILARWLGDKLTVLIMDEPTRGIDVGTKNEFYNLMYQMAESGISIICISSDLPEVMGTCDRLAVMREGKIVKILQREEFDKEKIMNLALPAKHKEHQPA